jgi:hypothetical protein
MLDEISCEISLRICDDSMIGEAIMMQDVTPAMFFDLNVPIPNLYQAGTRKEKGYSAH